MVIVSNHHFFHIPLIYTRKSHYTICSFYCLKSSNLKNKKKLIFLMSMDILCGEHSPQKIHCYLLVF